MNTHAPEQGKTLLDADGVPTRFRPRMACLWQTADGSSFLEYRFSAHGRSARACYVDTDPETADAWFRANRYEPPASFSPPPRVPSVDQLRPVVDALKEFFGRIFASPDISSVLGISQ